MIGGVRMDYFNYPLDTKILYRKKAKIRRELLEQTDLIKKKIAILGGSTTRIWRVLAGCYVWFRET